MNGAGSDPGTDELPPGLVEVLDRVTPVAETFREAGHRFYLVGGIVRDQLLGRGGHEHDLDVTTDARPDEIRRLMARHADAVWDQGARFGTIAARSGDDVYEITTHRADAYSPDSRKPAVVFGDTVEDDLARRDFTVNAMAVEAFDRRLVDPFGGRRDLAEHRLRTPSGPGVSFSEDPLRMLRAARFIAGYGLEPAPALVDAVHSMGDRLGIVSAERVRDEITKLLGLDRPGPGFDFLADTGLLARVVPELVDVDRTRWRDRIAGVPAAPGPRWAALLAPLGPDGARRRLRALRASNRLVDEVATLVGLVDDPPEGTAAPALRRFVRRLRGRIDPVTAAEFAVAVGAAPPELVGALDVLAAREDLHDTGPDLDGEAVMAELGIGPGPLVGEALAHLEQVRVEEGPLGRDEARRRLREWWSRRR